METLAILIFVIIISYFIIAEIYDNNLRKKHVKINLKFTTGIISRNPFEESMYWQIKILDIKDDYVQYLEIYENGKTFTHSEDVFYFWGRYKKDILNGTKNK